MKMTELKLYNTLTRKKEVFKPIKKEEAGMYSCGPTVYWFQHIGNMRAYLFADALKRVLEYNGYKVKHVINVTDVGHLTSDADEGEDKMEKAAVKEGKSAEEIAGFYFKVFREDLKKLNIKEPSVWCRATEHIKEQIELIKKLEEKGFTYKTSDGIYFNSTKFKDYGKLARLKIGGLESGKRVAFGEKKHRTDFALWKFSSPGEKRQQEWKSPWGVGFPGWHVECSAMSMKYLGENFDIHTGGEDHISVHHTNEIAQSESATGKKFVDYWMHVAFLLNKGEKVSKSKGGFFTVSELQEKGYNPLDFRYLCLLTHYRKPLNFSLDNLDAAKNAHRKMIRKIVELKSEKHKGQDDTEKYEELFENAINDDLNLSEAIGVVWGMLDDFNFDPKKKLKLLERFDQVLGLGIKEMKEEKVEASKEILELVKEREKLRKAKMWADADIFRERILEKGFIVSDTDDGPRLEKI
ncbi:MAG: cysteine--tRNA ligase [Nanoarchaeota archaeon]|nr:cysteine--tRNA ligase [Nanoarchaeota archaeon]MBU0977740.1 cysteine--tRNA ligase [Nanoarchaeota archaeon]